MRKALVVGVDHYSHIGCLHGCVNDAHSVKSVLERNSDGSVNFTVRLLVANGPGSEVNRLELRKQIEDLFSGDSDIALFYFAGHGHLDTVGGNILASDSRTAADGVPFADVIALASKSKAKNKVIILDSCHAGSAGARSDVGTTSEIADGLTILTAATADQYASEENGQGVFTTLLVDALSGAAGNLVGDITPGSVYAHIDQSLGPWEQRPVFKTNVKSFVSLRKVQPPIGLSDLRKLKELFPIAGHEIKLDPSFEPERPIRDQAGNEITAPPIKENTEILALLQKLNRVNLVVPVDAPHMFHAAAWSKACKLTVLGEHYRRLVERDRI